MPIACAKEFIFRNEGITVRKNFKRVHFFFQLKDEIFCVVNTVSCNIIENNMKTIDLKLDYVNILINNIY